MREILPGIGQTIPLTESLEKSLIPERCRATSLVIEMFDLLGKGWASVLQEQAARARHHCFVCAPFVTNDGANLLLSSFSNEFRRNGELRVLADLSPDNILNASTSPEALRSLIGAFDNGNLWHLPRLHAKVYIFDYTYAIVTSANLTSGGLFRNFEFGIGISERDSAKSILDELEAYAALGALVERPRIDAYCSMATDLRAQFANQLRTVSRRARMAFRRAIRTVEDELIRIRSRGGRVTPLFADTVRFLLERHGPLSTKELHPLVQQIHPDLCDDSVDRVIDGVHYGKKWKHWVRSAQRRLKSEGTIELAGGKWRLRRQVVGIADTDFW